MMRDYKIDECPYCGNDDIHQQMSGHDPLGDGDQLEIECPSCDKVIIVQADWSVSYRVYDAPCLNGESPHDYKPIVGYPEEYFKNKYSCAMCGDKITK